MSTATGTGVEPRAVGAGRRATGRPPRSGAPGWMSTVVWGWLLVFLGLPLLILVNFSLAEMGDVRPQDLIRQDGGALSLAISLEGYRRMVDDALYLRVFALSLGVAAGCTALCLLIGYPFALALARTRAAWRPVLLLLVVLPFWTAMLLRLVAWKGLLSPGGWVAEALVASGADRLLLAAGLIDDAGLLMNTPFSLLLGLTYTYLPFMVLPIVANLLHQDPRLLEAARDLGARPWVGFWTVTVPLSRPAVVAGSMLVFIPCVGEFVVPELLGGSRTLMIGRLLWDELFANNDWPMACALALAVLLLVSGPLLLFNRQASANGHRAARP